MKNFKVPITKPDLQKEEESAVLETIRSGWITQGQQVEKFEEMVAKYVGAKYAIATSSCTTALHLALKVLGVGKDDEVIVPSYTHIATANAIIYCEAKPVFIDIDPTTYNLDVNKIEPLITRKTKAIIPVHQVGLPAKMDTILAIARKYKIEVIEDAACALGSAYKDKKVGSISELTCFSFHPRKLITTGEGGMITTNRKVYAVLIRRLRDHGRSISDLACHNAKGIIFTKYKELGFNYRMPDICAALGLAQISRLGEIIKKRIFLANRYNNAFENIFSLEVPDVPAYVRHNYQSYILRVNRYSPISRDNLMRKLFWRGIATSRIAGIHLESYYRSRYGKIHLPETEKAVKEAMLIPLYTQMTKKEQDFVIESIISIVK